MFLSQFRRIFADPLPPLLPPSPQPPFPNPAGTKKEARGGGGDELTAPAITSGNKEWQDEDEYEEEDAEEEYEGDGDRGGSGFDALLGLNLSKKEKKSRSNPGGSSFSRLLLSRLVAQR